MCIFWLILPIAEGENDWRVPMPCHNYVKIPLLLTVDLITNGADSG